VGRSSFGRNRKNERVGAAIFFEPLGVGHPRSERLGSPVVDGVAYDRSADAKMAPSVPSLHPDFVGYCPVACRDRTHIGLAQASSPSSWMART
jgi:hypothetical protein